MWTVAFIAVIGLINAGISLASLWTWTLLTLVVSYIHYAWDGMIWKAPAKKKVSSAPV